MATLNFARQALLEAHEVLAGIFGNQSGAEYLAKTNEDMKQMFGPYSTTQLAELRDTALAAYPTAQAGVQLAELRDSILAACPTMESDVLAGFRDMAQRTFATNPDVLVANAIVPSVLPALAEPIEAEEGVEVDIWEKDDERLPEVPRDPCELAWVLDEALNENDALRQENVELRHQIRMWELSAAMDWKTMPYPHLEPENFDEN